MFLAALPLFACAFPNYRSRFLTGPVPPDAVYNDSFDFLKGTTEYKCIVREHQTPATAKEQPTKYLMEKLSGMCFEMTHTFFWYFRFCPFQNLTQYRFDEKIGDKKIDKFVIGRHQGLPLERTESGFADQFTDGDSCIANNKPRAARVEFVCDLSVEEPGKLASVSEPSFCNYLVRFHTPHVCGFENITNEDLHIIECYTTK